MKTAIALLLFEFIYRWMAVTSTGACCFSDCR